MREESAWGRYASRHHVESRESLYEATKVTPGVCVREQGLTGLYTSQFPFGLASLLLSCQALSSFSIYSQQKESNCLIGEFRVTEPISLQ